MIVPFTVLRRLDCVLEPTKAAVLAEHAARQKQGVNAEPFLLRKAKQSFYNTSPLDMKKLMGDQDHIRENLFAYIQAFAPAVRDIRALRILRPDRPLLHPASKTRAKAAFHAWTQSCGQYFEQRVDGFIRSPKVFDFPNSVENCCMVPTIVEAVRYGSCSNPYMLCQVTWKSAG